MNDNLDQLNYFEISDISDDDSFNSNNDCYEPQQVPCTVDSSASDESEADARSTCSKRYDFKEIQFQCSLAIKRIDPIANRLAQSSINI